MKKWEGKRLLILGGRPIGIIDIINCAHNNGAYVIVTDNLPSAISPGKQIADEIWDISTDDIDSLIQQIGVDKVDGVYAGVNEFCLKKMLVLCERLGLPCYCNLNQWSRLENKANFKQLCREFDIPVTREYSFKAISDLEKQDIDYPVIAKPVDGCASNGFSVCNDHSELKKAYLYAKGFSECGEVLIEKKMNYHNSVIINYTIIDGKPYFSGISDKYSEKVSLKSGPIMSLQYYSSKFRDQYLSRINQKAIDMLTSIGFNTAVVWIEAFLDNNSFVFNEIGLRFGGSLTYLPVRYLYGFDQLEMMIEYSLSGESSAVFPAFSIDDDKVYSIFPVHVRKGKITRVSGLDELKERKEILHIVQVHYVGDMIEEWCSAAQVFAYIHFVAETRDEARTIITWISETLHLYNENGEDLVFDLVTRDVH